MADDGESLDFLALLDEVADETVSRLVCEMGTHSGPCAFGDRDTLDILSICDSTSSRDSTARNFGNDHGVADDRHEHVPLLKMEEPSSDNTCDGVKVALTASDSALPSTHRTVMMLHLKPSANAQLGPGQGSSGKLMPTRRRNRWQFTTTQRSQLDAMFKKHLYPSKLEISELSSTLQVPVRTIRVWFQNRRWRLRKSQGITCTLATRGSRSMLPEKRQASSEEHQPSPVASPSVWHETANSAIISPVTQQSCTPPDSSKPVAITAANIHHSHPTAALATAQTALFPSRPSPPLVNILPSPQPHFGGMGLSRYNWGMSNVVAGWNLPAPAALWPPPAAVRLPNLHFAFPFSPWQNYAMSVLPRPYCPTLSGPFPVGQTLADRPGSAGCGGSGRPSPLPSGGTPVEGRTEGGTFPATYHYMGAPAALANSYSQSTFVRPASSLNEENDRSIDTSPGLSVPLEKVGSPWMSTARESCAISRDGLVSHASPVKMPAPSLASPSQIVRPFGMYPNAYPAPSWPGFAPPTPLTYPNLGLLQPHYSGFSPLTSPQLSSSLYKVGDTRQQSSASIPVETDGAVDMTGTDRKLLSTGKDYDGKRAELLQEGVESDNEGVDGEMLDVTTVSLANEDDVSSTSDQRE